MFSFTFRLLLLASAFFALTIGAWALPTDKSLTHHRNGMGVGSFANSNLVALTASATAQVEIPIGVWKAGNFT